MTSSSDDLGNFVVFIVRWRAQVLKSAKRFVNPPKDVPMWLLYFWYFIKDEGLESRLLWGKSAVF